MASDPAVFLAVKDLTGSAPRLTFNGFAKFFEGSCFSFIQMPTLKIYPIRLMAPANADSLLPTLTILPMIEASQSILDAVIGTQ